MNFAPLIAAETDGFHRRAAKWLVGFDFDSAKPGDIVEYKLLGLPQGWALLFTLLAVAALVWLTFALYRREGKTTPPRRKLFLALTRTAVVVLALVMFLEPTRIVSRVQQTFAPVVVLLDSSDSMSIEDLYADRVQAAGVAASTGARIETVLNQRLRRDRIVESILNNPALSLLNRLAEKNPVRVLAFDVKAKEMASLPLLSASGGEAERQKNGYQPGSINLPTGGGQTCIGRAVNQVLAAAGGQPLAAILVLSDGQDNDPDLDATAAAAEYARREGVPVYAVPVGLTRSAATKNIKLEKQLRANQTLFVGDAAEFTALVSSSGYRNVTVKAALYRAKVGKKGEEQVASSDVVISANASGQPISLTHTPQDGDEGEYIYTMKIEPLPDEHLQRDNAAVASGVRVVKTTANVLLIAGSPSWEFRNLKNLLIRDRTVNLSCWLQGAGRAYPQLGNRLLSRLPETREELNDPKDGYHVIILIDIDPADFGADWFKNLNDFVSEKAGGLLYVAGEKFTYDLFEARAAASEPLARMLPVELDMDRAPMFIGPGPKGPREWPLRPTEDGLQSPLLKFSTEREMTERLWQALPGVIWSFPVRKAKLGATVLMRTMDPRQVVTASGKSEPMPALVAGFFGKGRVAFMAFDESWRWRRIGTQVYETFWTQMVRSLMEGRLLGGRRSALLETDSETYPLGTAITMSARVFDSSGNPQRVPSVTVEVELMARGEHEKDAAEQPVKTSVKLLPVPGADGTYKNQYVPPRTGYYKLTLKPTEPGETGETTASIEVASKFEFDHPEANRVRLEEVTNPTAGGGLVELRDLGKLPDRIESRREQTIEPGEPNALWANPLLLGAVVALLGLEWAVRKRSNLA